MIKLLRNNDLRWKERITSCDERLKVQHSQQSLWSSLFCLKIMWYFFLNFPLFLNHNFPFVPPSPFVHCLSIVTYFVLLVLCVWCVCTCMYCKTPIPLAHLPHTVDYAEQLRIMQKTKEKLEIALENHQDCTYLLSTLLPNYFLSNVSVSCNSHVISQRILTSSFCLERSVFLDAL